MINKFFYLLEYLQNLLLWRVSTLIKLFIYLDYIYQMLKFMK